ncbi:hypothetical protein F4804DRAFT_336913 [Jackrogersella minutella]|nr:hypothetical protein F4804DRAFT_336913 [Jackrogersella minutella]
MTSRFVSAGTITGDGHHIEPPQRQSTAEASSPPPRAQNAQQWDKPEASKNESAWEAVQRDLEADRRRREEARRAQVEGGAGGERSLYDVLQANKAAKQAAFEEQNRIRNQFRALDDDEIDFLDGVRDEQRTEEERVKRETEERLARFREAQRAAGGSGSPDAEEGGESQDGGEDAVVWTGAGKKRKRGDKDAKSIVKGVKRRASVNAKEGETTAAPPESKSKAKSGEIMTVASLDADPKPSTTVDRVTPLPAKAEKAKLKLGLVDYGSDEDESD